MVMAVLTPGFMVRPLTAFASRKSPMDRVPSDWNVIAPSVADHSPARMRKSRPQRLGFERVPVLTGLSRRLLGCDAQ